MAKKVFFALAVAVAGCSSAPDASQSASHGDGPEGATTEQLRAFQALQVRTAKQWTWMQHEIFQTPAHLSAERTGAPLLVRGVTAEKATRQFLAQYKDLFKMRDPDAELALTRSRTDELGMTHARFQQVTHGIPVVGAELMAHYDAAGRLTSMDAAYVPGVDGLDLEPKIDAAAGLAIVKNDVLARTPDVDESRLEPDAGKLVVWAGKGTPYLAFQYTVRAIAGAHPAIWVTTVDAKTGAILDQYDNLQTVEASGTGVLGDTKRFEVAQQGGGYTMTDASRGVQIQTTTADGQQQTPGTPETSNALDQWDANVTGAGAAVDAHVYAGVVYDFYKKTFARNAIDGKGTAMVSTVHFGQAYDNAFWDGQGMNYGDGGQLFKPLSAALDVCGHEFTHGVTQAESNLSYQNQSGALNEAVSDIFGVFIEHSFKPDPVNNWIMGEAISKGAAGVIRDFKNPAAGDQPANMSQYRNTQQDNGGVHINSGIINNAAYLMTMGGTNPTSNVQVKYGIGWDKSEKIWYRANTQYFTSTTNFGQAAQGVLEAAKDIALTANETAIVDCAWKAVGVAQGTCATITDPNATPQSTTPSTTGANGDGTTTGGAPGATDGTGSEDDGSSNDGTDGTGSSTTNGGHARPRSKSPTYSGNGCHAGARGDTDFGPLAGLLAAVLGLAAKRRRSTR